MHFDKICENCQFPEKFCNLVQSQRKRRKFSFVFSSPFLSAVCSPLLFSMLIISSRDSGYVGWTWVFLPNFRRASHIAFLGKLSFPSSTKYGNRPTLIKLPPLPTLHLGLPLRAFPLTAISFHCITLGLGQNRRRGNGSDTTATDRGSGETSVRTTADGGGSGAAIRSRENPRRLMIWRRRKATAAATRERRRMTKC